MKDTNEYDMSELVSERKNKGLTQADVAKILGVSRQTYCSYEKGKTPDIEHLKTLSVFFDRPIDALIGIKKDMQFKQHPITQIQQELLDASRGLSDASMHRLIESAKELRLDEKAKPKRRG